MLCTLNIFIRCKVIHNKCNLALIKHFLLIKLFHLVNGNWCCDIVTKH